MIKSKFNSRELEHTEVYPGVGKIPKLQTPITPRENFVRAVKRMNPLWVPCMTDQLVFNPHIYPDNVARSFVVEEKLYSGEKGGVDVFGIPWKYIEVAGGSMVEPGVPLLKDCRQWKKVIRFPDISQWDWEGCAKENEKYLDTDRVVCMWIFSGLFERLISFMDFENAAVALIDEDQAEAVKELFQCLVEFYKELIDNFIGFFHPDLIYFHDDWGSQRAPFFSLDTCREMLVPYMKQIVDHCHDHGLLFELHSCGKNERLVPAMIESGIDIWGGQAIVDKKYVISNYGDQLMVGIHSGLEPIPGGKNEPYTVDDMHKEFRQLLKTYAGGMPKRPVYLMNYIPDAEEHIVFYEEGRKYLYELLN